MKTCFYCGKLVADDRDGKLVRHLDGKHPCIGTGSWGTDGAGRREGEDEGRKPEERRP